MQTRSADFNSMVGFELESLAAAEKYQQWLTETVEPYLGRRILELGAGTGNMSVRLPVRERLIVTEASPELFGRLRVRLETAGLAGRREVSAMPLDLLHHGLSELRSEALDTIISFNVLEHIEDDVGAIRAMGEVLREGGGPTPRRIITFAPAHQWAYGAVDHAAGHYRRYSVRRWRELQRAAAPDAKLYVQYFNAIGLAGWMVNGKLFRKAGISPSSIRIFEALCPVIRPLDRFLHRGLRLPLGQSILAVLEWR